MFAGKVVRRTHQVGSGPVEDKTTLTFMFRKKLLDTPAQCGIRVTSLVKKCDTVRGIAPFKCFDKDLAFSHEECLVRETTEHSKDSSTKRNGSPINTRNFVFRYDRRSHIYIF